MHSVRIFWDGCNPLKVSAKNSKIEVLLEDMVVWAVEVRRNLVVSGVNGVVVDRHGLILRENEAMGGRKVFSYLLCLRDNKESKNGGQSQQI